MDKRRKSRSVTAETEIEILKHPPSEWMGEEFPGAPCPSPVTEEEDFLDLNQVHKPDLSQDTLTASSSDDLECYSDDEDEEENEKRLEEDARLDYVFRMQKALNEKFQNSTWIHPHGLTEFDYCLIPPCCEERLEEFKLTTVRESYKYMDEHPELNAILSVFFKSLLKTQPEDAVNYAIKFFTFRQMHISDMKRMVRDELERLHKINNPKPLIVVDKEETSAQMSTLNDVKKAPVLCIDTKRQQRPAKVNKTEKKPAYCKNPEYGHRHYHTGSHEEEKQIEE